MAQARARDADPLGSLCHAEVDEARNAVAAHEDVLRTDVSVHDVQRSPLDVLRLVGGVQAREGVRQDAYDDGGR